MSRETKTYIPSWLWTELEIFIIYPESKHADTKFVIQKEGYDANMYANFRIVNEDVQTRFNIGDTIKWVHILVTDEDGRRDALFGTYLYRLDTETVELLDHARRLINSYKLSDIVRIRDSMNCRRIIFDDTKPLWSGHERFNAEVFHAVTGFL